MKREIILLMCLMLQSSALSVEFAGGTGEPNDPYQIATAEQLIAIGSDPNLLDKSFVLVADIDLDPNLPGGRVFKDALIAQDDCDGVSGHVGPSFDGILDGQGHTIANLHIEGKYGYDAALFGIFSGLVKDLRLTDVVVSGTPCGAIASFNLCGMILRCSVTGQVSGIEIVGGLVGSSWDASLVDCVAQVQVTGEDNVGGMVGVTGGIVDVTGGIVSVTGSSLMRCKVQAEVSGHQKVGGLVGIGSYGQIHECRATGTVIGSDDVGGLIGSSGMMIWRSSANCEVTAEQIAGGLAGSAHRGSGLLIADCYAQGSVTGSIVGGLVGRSHHAQFMNCYAACELFPMEAESTDPLVGGLFGDIFVPNWAPMTAACSWDAELSGVAISTGSHPIELGTGLTTEQMQDEDVFRSAGWDFSNIWMICEGDYPRLQWEIEDCNDI